MPVTVGDGGLGTSAGISKLCLMEWEETKGAPASRKSCQVDQHLTENPSLTFILLQWLLISALSCHPLHPLTSGSSLTSMGSSGDCHPRQSPVASLRDLGVLTMW